jgi:hypothetical protein
MERPLAAAELAHLRSVDTARLREDTLDQAFAVRILKLKAELPILH